MVIEYEKYSPFDYSDEKVEVFFKIASVVETKKLLSKIDYIGEIKTSKYGVTVDIAIQQIPEIVQYLAENRIAIYGVIAKEV